VTLTNQPHLGPKLGHTKSVYLLPSVPTLNVTFTYYMQGDQKVSVHLMMYCNPQVHRDFLITLYNTEFSLPRLPILLMKKV